jgi:SPP1 family predicted phage head-tail adaptor
MQAGDLRERVTIKQVTSTSDGAGGYTESGSSALATVWAAVEPLSGRELLAALQAQSEVTVRVRMRYRSDVTAAMQLLHGSKTYEVVSPPIDRMGKRRELELMCKEIV